MSESKPIINISLHRSPHRMPPDRDIGQGFYKGSMWLRIERRDGHVEWWPVNQRSMHKAGQELLEALTLIADSRSPILGKPPDQEEKTEA